jgi:hypothetical protein
VDGCELDRHPRYKGCGLGERAKAKLKSWRILCKLRCCPWRAVQLARAIRVPQTREIGGWKRLDVLV